MGSFTFSDPTNRDPYDGVNDVVGYRYGFTNPPVNYVTAASEGGAATVKISPVWLGNRTLYVQAVDRAGNLSPDDSSSPPAEFDIATIRPAGNPTPLLAWWKLGEGSGTTAADATGNGHDATLGAQAGWGVRARLGHVEAAVGLPAVDSTGSFTVSAWVKLSPACASSPSTCNFYAAVSQDGVTGYAFALEYVDQMWCAPGAGDGVHGCWAFTMPTSDSTSPAPVRVEASTAVAVGAWVHLTGVYDQVHQQINIYVNGQPAAAWGPVGGVQPWAGPAMGPLRVGRLLFNGGAYEWWPGEISDVCTFRGGWTPLRSTACTQAAAAPRAPRKRESSGGSAVTTMRTGARTLARLRRLAAASLATVCASLAVPAPALASAAPVPRDHHLPAAPSASLVPAHPVTAGRPVAPPAANVVTSVPAPNWPAAGAADVDLPATAPAGAATGVTATGVGTPAMVPVRAGGLPVQVGSSSASRVRVQVPGHAAAQQAGATGFLFRMDRTDGGGQPAPVTARLDYSGFAQAYGGGFASRLTVVALPSCAATTPQLPACQVATPVPTANDLSARTLTVQMNAQPAITSPTSTLRAAASGSRSAGGTAVLAVTTTTSGGTGDYKASSLTPSGTWQVGLQTGDFTWQYPFRVPPPIGGHAPAVSLAYDSAPRPARPVPVARRMLRPVCPSRCDSRTSASRVCCWRRV